MAGMGLRGEGLDGLIGRMGWYFLGWRRDRFGE